MGETVARTLQGDRTLSWLGKRRRLRTARCILRQGDTYLLVVHRGGGREHVPRWGLPGGHLDFGEAPEVAVRRELREELFIDVDDLLEVGDYRFRNGWHRVYTATLDVSVERFDDSELLQIGWHGLAEIAQFHQAGQLHAGYELDALHALFERLRSAG